MTETSVEQVTRFMQAKEVVEPLAEAEVEDLVRHGISVSELEVRNGTQY